VNYYYRAACSGDLVLIGMDTINRSAIIVRPAQPFLYWLHRVDSTSAHLNVHDLQREPTIYLVPECDSLDQALESLEESIRAIFEEQLDGWYRAPEVWPAKRDLATFQSWFEVSFHSMIVDLSDDVLEHDEL
jgi:hypothetical protein